MKLMVCGIAAGDGGYAFTPVLRPNLKICAENQKGIAKQVHDCAQRMPIFPQDKESAEQYRKTVLRIFKKLL